jgi:ribosomal protein L40E
MCWSAFRLGRIIRAYPMASWFSRRCEASSGDARRCRAPHHEGLRPHPRMSAFALTREERALARVSKDEATELENALETRGADGSNDHPFDLVISQGTNSAGGHCRNSGPAAS